MNKYKKNNSKGMVLAIDMGNTNIVIGCIDEKKYYLKRECQQIFPKQNWNMQCF